MEMRAVTHRTDAMYRVTGVSGRCMLRVMKKTLSPIESEVATPEEAEAYDRWLRAKVQAARADSRQRISHDRVMEEMDAMIRAAESEHSAKRL